MKLAARAVLYSGSKLNFEVEQSNGLVFMKPFAPEAIMKPLLPVVWSVSTTSKAWPPLIAASNIRTVILSPGFMNSVCAFGVNVLLGLELFGPGGPAGTPLVWTNAKFTGSTQLLLQFPEPLPWHSRLSMLSAEHHCLWLQLMLSMNGPKPGG